ncbi:hypothetical protein UPYG_G00050600 [Umbra pygmaea]|uniref:Uncharacterized protein n=1 Tax=Umbra pygmaea TaxID=75934 RepID=A0ABD0YFR0_UMBPY
MSRMDVVIVLMLLSLIQPAQSGGKPAKKVKKGKQVICPSQLSAEEIAQVPANSTSNILNRLMVTYDPRIRPNFKGMFLHFTAGQRQTTFCPDFKLMVA